MYTPANVASWAVETDLLTKAEAHQLKPDGLVDGVARLRTATADVLYAPGLRDIDSVRAVTSAVTKPVNVVMGSPGATLDVGELAAVGVKRISLGSACLCAALGEFLRAALEVRDEGRFTFAEIEAHFAPFEARDQVRDGTSGRVP